MQKTYIFRRKTVIHTLQQHKLTISSAEVHKNHNISRQVLWNWLMLVLNHKNLLSYWAVQMRKLFLQNSIYWACK